jgi:DNA-directed RNA polymerase sigma subunit (sigma70/sigma32)
VSGTVSEAEIGQLLADQIEQHPADQVGRRMLHERLVALLETRLSWREREVSKWWPCSDGLGRV